jgi:hypothetical protein
VRAQVDRDLTTVSIVDRLLWLNKNLGCHTLVLRWECYAEATSEQRDRRSCVSGSLVISQGGGFQVAAGERTL